MKDLLREVRDTLAEMTQGHLRKGDGTLDGQICNATCECVLCILDEKIEAALLRILASATKPSPTQAEVREAMSTIMTCSPLNHHPDYMVGVGPDWRKDYDAAVVRLQHAADVLERAQGEAE